VAIIEPARKGSEVNVFAKRSGALAVCLAIAAGGVAAGCGDDDVNKAVSTAKEKVDKAAKDVKKAVPDDAEKKIDEAGNKAGEAADTAHDKAETALKDATGSDDTKPDDSGGGY
jgi:hypothetical protein